MKTKLFAVLFAAAFALWGCSSSDSGSEEGNDGSISIELPVINDSAGRLGVSDISLFVLQITSESIGYSNTIESDTGGIISIDKLAEARYEISVEAFDSERDVILSGSSSANVFIGEVTYAQIELDFTFGALDIAVILPNEDLAADLEIGGIFTDNSGDTTVVHGPGIFIERLLGGPFTYTPGPASTKVFAIETGEANAMILRDWFDAVPDPRSGSLIVKDLAGNESYRWNLLEITPMFYQPGSDGRTQFFMSVLIYEMLFNVSVFNANYDPDKDRGIEISGVTPEDMFAEVRDDVDNTTLTLTFGYEAGLQEIDLWVNRFVDGIPEIRSMSVITFGPGGTDDEVARRNYFEVFPIRFEQVNGFGTDVKGRFRLMMSYELSQDANP